MLLDYLDTTFKPIDNQLSELLKERKITYSLLWALFPPNGEVYTTCKGTQASRCLLFDQMEEKKGMDGSKYMELRCRYLGFDGKIVGEVATTESIPIFSGAQLIERLLAFPFRWHPEKDKIRTLLEACGRTWVSLLGVHHREYQGLAFDYDDKDKIAALSVDGNIMVDPVSFREQMPNYPSARVQRVRRESGDGRSDELKPVDIDPSQLTPKQLVTCSPTVLGFSLEKKRYRT